MNKDKVNNEEILSEDMNPIKVGVEDDESTVSIVDPVEEANKKVEEYTHVFPIDLLGEQHHITVIGC